VGKKVKESKDVKLGERVMFLPCRLTEDELADRQAELVEKTKGREAREAAYAAWKSQMKETAKVHEADICHVATACFRLAGIIEAKEEPRDVTVGDWIDEAGNVRTVRPDTGEVVSVRPATEGERQRSLDL
jgi:hypothetical protein